MKEETKQQSETPVKQQDNTIDPKEVKKELNELVYGVPLYHNDSPVGYKKQMLLPNSNRMLKNNNLKHLPNSNTIDLL